MRTILDRFLKLLGALGAFFIFATLLIEVVNIVGRELGYSMAGADAYAGYFRAAGSFLALARAHVDLEQRHGLDARGAVHALEPPASGLEPGEGEAPVARQDGDHARTLLAELAHAEVARGGLDALDRAARLELVLEPNGLPVHELHVLAPVVGEPRRQHLDAQLPGRQARQAIAPLGVASGTRYPPQMIASIPD